MGLRIFSLFVVLFISTNAQTTKDDDQLLLMSELVTDLQSTVSGLQSTVTNLVAVIYKLEQKVEKLEEAQLQVEETTTEQIAPAAGVYTNAHNCRDVYESGQTEDGVYTVMVNNRPLQVYCQDGGWTVIQKRSDNSLGYNRNFAEYAEGFGSAGGQHWLGLNHVHDLTSTGNWTLRIDLTAYNDDTAYAEYDEFSIDPGTDFTLRFNKTSYRGTAGKALNYQQGRKFTTSDMDQDTMNEETYTSGNCADDFGEGGWWYGNCALSTTTGMPYGEGAAIIWYNWKGFQVLKAATMKIWLN